MTRVTKASVVISWNGKNYASAKPISIFSNWGLNCFKKLPAPTQGLLVRALNDGASSKSICLSLIAEFPKDKAFHYNVHTINMIAAGLKTVGIMNDVHRAQGRVVTARVDSNNSKSFDSLLSVK